MWAHSRPQRSRIHSFSISISELCVDLLTLRLLPEWNVILPQVTIKQTETFYTDNHLLVRTADEWNSDGRLFAVVMNAFDFKIQFPISLGANLEDTDYVARQVKITFQHSSCRGKNNILKKWEIPPKNVQATNCQVCPGRSSPSVRNWIRLWYYPPGDSNRPPTG